MANRTGKGQFHKGKDSRRGKGGARPGAGRKPGWLKERCDQLLLEANKDGLAPIEFMGQVARREKVARMKVDGKDVEVFPEIETTMDAIKWLADRAHGKPAQAVEHSGSINQPVTFDIYVEGVKQ